MKDAVAGASKVLAYLAQQNRPYSAGDIFSNLHKEVGKTAVVKALEDLAQQGKVREKVYGKQKVYMVCQSDESEMTEEEMAAVDAEAAEVQKELTGLEAECRTKEATLSGLTSALTTEEAEKQLAIVSKEVKEMEERLDQIKGGSNHISPGEKEKICKQHDLMKKTYRKRKRMAMEVVDSILEGYPKSKKQLLEEIGIETDEDAGFAPPKDR
eukprot:scpid60107/ scgid10808/ Homologous-pairing protein 2 homolog; Nuclear receptor coactivator GT198; PSMC3-interacting protein; Proteasome 26S ATPase subunit 3-interacting protein